MPWNKPKEHSTCHRPSSVCVCCLTISRTAVIHWLLIFKPRGQCISLWCCSCTPAITSVTALHSNDRIREWPASDLHSPPHLSLSHSLASTAWQSATDSRSPPATDDLCSALIQASAPLTFFLKALVRTMRALCFRGDDKPRVYHMRPHEQGGGMNRSFRGISGDDFLPSVLINTHDGRQVQVGLGQMCVDYMQVCVRLWCWIAHATSSLTQHPPVTTHFCQRFLDFPWLAKLIGH